MYLNAFKWVSQPHDILYKFLSVYIMMYIGNEDLEEDIRD